MADGKGWGLDPDKLLATVDDPAHFRKSRSVGAYAGLTVCHSASSSGLGGGGKPRMQHGWPTNTGKGPNGVSMMTISGPM